jgi:hypothetical protein
VPEPDELLPREGFDPLVDPDELPRFPESLLLLDPPELPLLPELLLPDRDPLPELLDPLMPPLEPLELCDEPDEPWSFLLFAIHPPALSGRTDCAAQHARSNASAGNEKGNIYAIFLFCLRIRSTQF